METIRGKGLIAISTVLMAVVWFDVSLTELSFYGITFKNTEEWKFLTPLSLTFLLFSIRYLQGFAEMKASTKLAFIKYLSSRKGLKPVYKNTLARRTAIHETEESLIIKSANEIEKSGWYYLKFAFTRRTFLNYFLPIPFAVGALVAICFLLFA